MQIRAEYNTDDIWKNDMKIMNIMTIINAVDKNPPIIVISVFVKTAYVVKVTNMVNVAKAAASTVDLS